MLNVKSEFFDIKSFFSPLALDIFFWKLSVDQYCEDENIISLNDETFEICMNDVSMEDKSRENPSTCRLKQEKLKKMESEKLMKMNL